MLVPLGQRLDVVVAVNSLSVPTSVVVTVYPTREFDLNRFRSWQLRIVIERVLRLGKA